MVLHVVIRPILLVEFLKALYWDLYFSKSICNITDDNTLVSHGNTLPLILNHLKHNMRNLLYWFKINSFKSNSGKFQFIILGKNNRLEHRLKIGSITVKEPDVVKLFGKTIDKTLNLKNISKIYTALPSMSFNALRQIRK